MAVCFDPATELAGHTWRSDDVAGPTITRKLLARKRPALLPIRDRVIDGFSGIARGDLWLALRDALADEQRRARIDALGDGLARRPTTLRLLDVAIWMSEGRSTATRAARRGDD